MQTNILTQDKNLFPDLEWSSPTNRRWAGNLLIIGGNSQSFHSVIKTYENALKEIVKVVMVLPDSLEKIIPHQDNIIFVNSSASGSIADDEKIMPILNEVDHVLLAGDLTKNSETQLFIEKLITVGLPITFTDDSDHYLESLGLESGNLVFDFKSLQKILIKSKNEAQITSNMGTMAFAQTISEITKDTEINIVCSFNKHIFVSAKGKVSKTEIEMADMNALALKCAINSMNFPKKSFEALTYSVWQHKSNMDV